MATKTWEERETDRVDELCEEIRFQQLNEVLGKPVDLARVWAAWDELHAAYRDAKELANDEYQILKGQFEDMSSDCKEHEKRADDAEKEVAALEKKLEDIRDVLDE